MEHKDERGGSVRAGMVWGGIGGVVGFLVSLLGSLAGIVAAGFVGFYCGRRAASADRGRRAGALAGLLGGVVATPGFVLGASAGAVVAARGIGSAEMAATISKMLDMQISPEQAWNLFLLSLIVAALLQAAVLIGVSAAAGAWTARK